MADSGAPARTLRRGPAPIASFDHDGSDESSPETKQTFRLPEIREDPAPSSSLAPPERRARSHSTPAASTGLVTPATPRIDISRASSSSHHDSRDSSPELALFAGVVGEEERGRLELGFREDGALDLRSSTEELAFLEGAPGEPRAAAVAPPAARCHSRKDSQGSEAALLAVSGRTSRISSVGSQCSAHSALSAFSRTSRVSRLSVASGASRSPSPHRMLLETSFCGPKPIENDPEICTAAVEDRLLEIAKLTAITPRSTAPPPLDARDHREVRTEVTVERDAPRGSAPSPAEPPDPTTPPSIPAQSAPEPPQPVPEPAPPTPTASLSDIKRVKETQNQARAQERRARPRVRREPSEPEVYKSGNRTKDIIRIKLKPDDEYEEDAEETTTAHGSAPADGEEEMACTLESLELSPRVSRAVRPTELVERGEVPSTSPLASRCALRDSRTPSPAGPPISRKSSFCSLFKSREMIASPDSPSEALRRKRSLTEGRSRSKSRDRSATPSSAGKIKGSVLSLFRTPRRSATSPSPSPRDGSPVVQPQRQIAPPPQPREGVRWGEKLKYYEDAKDGIIHIPLRTPPDERVCTKDEIREAEAERPATEVTLHRERPRPASAPQTRPTPSCESSQPTTQKPIQRTVLHDGSIIIPLRSPTERHADERLPSLPVVAAESQAATMKVEGSARSITAERTVTDPPSPPREQVPVDTVPEVTQNVEATPASDEARRRRKERIVFSTQVGSHEQVFSTQFSITKTPSVTSEISGSFPSFVDCEEARPWHLAGATSAASDICASGGSARDPASEAGSARAESPDASRARDSSESEPSSESAATRGGNDVERRGLVVQESFEEELPYVPTTLPLERSLALPMVPVRERGGVRVSGVERPRGAAPAPPAAAPRVPRPPPAAPPPAAAPPDKLRIRLPRRPRTASVVAPVRTDRSRTRSGSDGGESRPKTDWIDFEEVPERRKQPKRIQTLPPAAASAERGGDAAAGGVVFSYVEPEHCRCECHGHARDDELPLLQDDMQPLHISSSSLECGEEARTQTSVAAARAFAADLDLQPEPQLDTEARH